MLRCSLHQYLRHLGVLERVRLAPILYACAGMVYRHGLRLRCLVIAVELDRRRRVGDDGQPITGCFRYAQLIVQSVDPRLEPSEPAVPLHPRGHFDCEFFSVFTGSRPLPFARGEMPVWYGTHREVFFSSNDGQRTPVPMPSWRGSSC